MGYGMTMEEEGVVPLFGFTAFSTGWFVVGSIVVNAQLFQAAFIR